MTTYRDIKDIAAEVKANLKKEFPACKFSVTIERYSGGQSMTIALMSAPFSAFASDTDVNGNKQIDDYAQLNQFQICREDYTHPCNGYYLTEQAHSAMKRAHELTLKDNWDNSDIQTDYFDVNFYENLAIGKWNRPFQNTH